MVKATSNDKPEPVQFLVTLQPVGEFVTLDNLPDKLKLICSGAGVKVLELEKVEDQDDDQSAGFMLV